MFIHGFFLILCGQLKILNAAPTASELSHSVFLTFSNITLGTWHAQGKKYIMDAVLANLTTDYCQAHSEECGVPTSTSTLFKSENVKTVNKYPKNKDTNLETLIYVEIPTTDGSTPGKVPGETLLAIITNNKSRLSSEIGYDLGRIISGLTPSDSAGQEVNNKLNKVMIPVAFLLLLVIAFICWILHRVKKKKQAREERRRYAALKNSKNGSNLREKRGTMVNTADKVPSTQLQPERGPTPDLDPPENQAEGDRNNNIRRHKKRRALPKKQPIKNAPAEESDDVFDDDPDEREKPKKKGRRRKGRRSYDINQEYEMQAANELACSQGSSEGTNGDSQVNRGYRQDSEKGESDRARNSNADSAVELSSSVASSANHSRARTLPPIPRASQQEMV